MTDIQPLQALLAQTERERDTAIQGQQRAQLAEGAARRQAEQLRAYRSDYEQRWQREFAQQAGRIELLHCYQGFMARLSMAVDSQARLADDAAAELERATGRVREQELRCASVRKLIERRLLDRRHDDERQVQRQFDELAARAAWSRLDAARQARTA